MSAITPVRKDIAHPMHVKKHSAGLRLWHWMTAVVISGSIITVWINSLFTGGQEVATLSQEALKKAGLNPSVQQVRAVPHALGDRVWAVHEYFGYVLAALFLFRLVLEFFQLTDQKFMRKMKLAYQAFQTRKKNRQLAIHELTVKLIYTAFYILLLMMVLTGLSLAFDDASTFLRSIRGPVKEVHGFGLYLVLLFIFVHLAGVFLAERKDGKGIVSDMINGGDNDPIN